MNTTKKARDFEALLLPKIEHSGTREVIKDLIIYSQSLETSMASAEESTMEPAPPRKQKPKPDFGKCAQIRKKIKEIASKYPKSDFNKLKIMALVEELLKYAEHLEKQQD